MVEIFGYQKDYFTLFFSDSYSVVTHSLHPYELICYIFSHHLTSLAQQH